MVDKALLSPLKPLVNDQWMWPAFVQVIDDMIAEERKTLEQSQGEVDLYRAQGAIQRLHRIKKLKEEVQAHD
ncbi:MAG TPA: hypothetical protein V6D20_09285 [Candidatus Obscuribacterales bacterium]